MSDARPPRKPTKRDVGPWVLPPPWLPAPYDLSDVVAIQALARGEADAEQQVRALKWIVEVCAGAYSDGWHPELADFAAGRRRVGMEIVKLTKLDVAKLKARTSDAD